MRWPKLSACWLPWFKANRKDFSHILHIKYVLLMTKLIYFHMCQSQDQSNNGKIINIPQCLFVPKGEGNK